MNHFISPDYNEGPDLSDLPTLPSFEAMFREIIKRHCELTIKDFNRDASLDPDEEALLVDHLSDLLIRHLDSDTGRPVRDATGKTIDHLKDMRREADSRIATSCRRAHTCVGDHALLTLGFSPELIPEQEQLREPITVEDYLTIGKSSYLTAAAIPPSNPEATSSDQLLTASNNFMLCAHSITITRNRLFSTRDNPSPL